MVEEARTDAARRVIEAERDGLQALADSIGSSFSDAVGLVLGASPYLIVTGVGKSGHVGRKIAASFASTGTPSFFVHPTEASHGDLGMIAPGCVVLAISNSGESRELKDVLVYCDMQGVPVIGITRNAHSTLGRYSSAVLALPDVAEAGRPGLAPTTSTTNTLALGDALMVAVMEERGFDREAFGKRHPGGKLGLSLQRAGDWLSAHPAPLPLVAMGDDARKVVATITEAGRGCVGVCEGRVLQGMITDGDLRRAMDARFFEKTAADMMTADPRTVPPEMKVSDVIALFDEAGISNAFITEDGMPVGLIDLKSLLAQGYL